MTRGWPERADLGRRTELPVLRAALWTLRAYWEVRRDLANTGVETVVRPPPALPRRAGRGVYGVLRRQPATCLERCLVLQRWLASQGELHDIVIGVAAGDGDFRAHAWLAFEEEAALDYEEIHRIPAMTS